MKTNLKPSASVASSSKEHIKTPEMDRHNGLIFLGNYLLMYLAAPVIYVGVVQAALCDKLGASATVANLPLAGYQLGSLAPWFFSWVVPHRFERGAVVWANAVTAVLLLLVGLTLILPMSDSVRISAIIAQGLLQGLSSSAAQVFQLQCLTRGTSTLGRIRALKLAFTFGPISAVIGSLGAQYVLNPGIQSVNFPHDFALLYLIAAPCIAGRAVLSSRFRLIPVEDEARKPLLRYLFASARSFFASSTLRLLWFAYVLWYCTVNAMPTLALYAKETLGRDPKDFAGLIMALRFGCKSLGGFGLGVLAARHGLRAGVKATVILLGIGILWAWMAPGYFYLLSFGLMGAGELGGAYFPNYVAVLSPVEDGPRNLSILTLVQPTVSFVPALHGGLTDQIGFVASFGFALAAAIMSLLLVGQVRDANGHNPKS